MNRFLASQLRKPHGWFGSLFVSRMLNRVNAQIVDATLNLLEIGPEQHVLEIGFGGGSALQLLARRLKSGVVTGVDFSPEMVRAVERRLHREIEAGRVQVQVADASNLPFPSATFDRVFTINTIYFWPDPLQALVEIHRVLKQDSRAAIGLRSREKMQTHGVTRYDFRLFSPEEVVQLMRQAGFRDVRLDHSDRDRWYDQVIVIGIR